VRDFRDRNGVKLRLLSVSGEDSFDGLLEGSPYMVRKLMIVEGRRWLSTTGRYCDGLDELEREVAAMDRDYHVWPPRYRWTATLVTNWDEAGDRGRLAVLWYEDSDGDLLSASLARLQEILSGIDFSVCCIKEQDTW
jgi:hypothetical protein